ncbi:hypothetical protein B0T26DRAFT_678162 [Lasiosphaeria miniovina]|uniref:Uncharacterized protein n=1 Tax=Lasiosphaeria miniovina TaxID=1954250 RepID=A0AA40DSI4_9PEZI|nr:uncharacterized protein B0T26DRAFT_678162 [Lasiosphaeria miniovina]KAK0713885.1 hypothetical protein B0T26DRAFT_678162 [Lasiosphaeria miniovina]
MPAVTRSVVPSLDKTNHTKGAREDERDDCPIPVEAEPVSVLLFPMRGNVLLQAVPNFPNLTASSNLAPLGNEWYCGSPRWLKVSKLHHTVVFVGGACMMGRRVGTAAKPKTLRLQTSLDMGSAAVVPLYPDGRGGLHKSPCSKVKLSVPARRELVSVTVDADAIIIVSICGAGRQTLQSETSSIQKCLA